jgi:hypothetical protein
MSLEAINLFDITARRVEQRIAILGALFWLGPSNGVEVEPTIERTAPISSRNCSTRRSCLSRSELISASCSA